MKTTKIFALAIALIMAFTLAACSDSGNNSPPPSETPSAPEPSTPSPNGAQGNGGNDPGTGDPDPGTIYGTIPMPDGFPENPGDAEYFNPITDDYLILHDPEAFSPDGEKIYHLVSYDASGEPVQWVTKAVWPGTDIPQSSGEGWGSNIVNHGSGNFVGNVGFLDSMAMYAGFNMDIPRWLSANFLPPTKESADWTSERNSVDGSYVIIVGENSWVQGPAPEHFYFSKP
ncbi:MAG: hypothetical protein FWG72_01245 [Oscillospiraceae bacterium]|nr:hypothetical protein [Oscillospiraceae bacterium]